jgi:hypothetical protein
LILIFLMNASFKSKIQFNGHKHASSDEMPVIIKVAEDAGVGDAPVLHSGARLAAKLNAKIILNDTEFNNPGEMSVDDRQLYHEALAALFPASITVSASEHSADDRDRRQRPRWSVLSLVARFLRLKR